ncbi:MAG: LysR family transcriptional regulator [Bradyrhizobium sp.]|uniref:LysR family transcriptional regulator n=1 Tax=Bradyrhizobium sp. TaxID=376 RepID=UPI0027308504|nr:LysR family transcriptional regulator [Bradyrhizobium sp.]MDP1867609.1 LysR family transcriptional regulator [Bradyrhizobium sp.]
MSVNSASAEMNAFVRVIERGSFAAAADDLGITPSALSKLVTRIEDRLGVSLLTRTTRRLALTAEGEVFVARSRDILASIEAAEAEVTAASRLPRGHLKISIGTALAKQILCPALPAFLSRYPDITVELHVSDHQVDLVAEQVDVAIRSGALGDSTLVARKITEAKRLICVSPLYLEKHGSPRVPADLLRHNCLTLPGPAWSQWPFHTHEGINRLVVSGTFTSDNADLLLDMAIAGLGIARLADFMVARPMREGALVPLLLESSMPESFPIHALTVPGRHRAPRIKAFVDFVAAQFDHAP